MKTTKLDFGDIPTDPKLFTASSLMFIRACIETNAEELVLEQKRLKYKGQNLGDWTVIVRRGIKK